MRHTTLTELANVFSLAAEVAAFECVIEVAVGGPKVSAGGRGRKRTPPLAEANEPPLPSLTPFAVVVVAVFVAVVFTVELVLLCTASHEHDCDSDCEFGPLTRVAFTAALAVAGEGGLSNAYNSICRRVFTCASKSI